MKDRRPLQRDQAQQRIRHIHREDAVEDNAAGRTQSQREQEAVLDQRTNGFLKGWELAHGLKASLYA
jgi:hypothetical protein